MYRDCLRMLISIASMLKENPASRPNIYQVLREACLMQGLDVPIKDVCSCLQCEKTKLTSVDICQKNPVRNQAKPATADTRTCCISSCYWSCLLPAHATKTGYS